MAHIQQLSPHVADLIAAGEVVERPASVVKELVENAMDAGASAVVAEIVRGGMASIRISDNGCGMEKSELPAAFLRHATSKLREEADLAAIGTLGFRGEALAAVSAVSRVEITSRAEGAGSGARLRLTAGVPEETEDAGCPVGTVITVRDLFYNTPARLKFMKKDSAEAAAVHGLMQHLALSRPAVSLRLLKDGEELLHTPGDGQLLSAVYAAFGREFAMSLTPVSGGSGAIRCAGFVTKPLASRGTRGMQSFFVNGRFVKSQLLTAALEEGYRNQLLKGKFPGCVLHVTLPAEEVDVNVHPAKTVVKFRDEKAVFDAVYYTVLDALGEQKPVPSAPAPETVRNPRSDFYQAMDTAAFRAARSGKPAGERAAAPSAPAEPSFVTRVPAFSEADTAVRAADSALPFHRVTPVETGLRETREGADAPRPVFSIRPPAAPEAPAQNVPAQETPAQETPAQETLAREDVPWRVAGEVLRTYIVCEDEAGTVHLIDKHAAHERILFDALRAGTHPIMSQTLLSPLAAELGDEEYAALLERLPLLASFGFECEDFGPGSLLIRALPAEVDAADAVSALEELAGELLRTRSTDPAAARDAVLHTVACKAAVKAGMHTSSEELAALAARVQSGEIRYCPHGRPVEVCLTKYQLEKMFRRA